MDYLDFPIIDRYLFLVISANIAYYINKLSYDAFWQLTLLSIILLVLTSFIRHRYKMDNLGSGKYHTFYEMVFFWLAFSDNVFFLMAVYSYLYISQSSCRH